MKEIAIGLLIPFIGTLLGASMVFLVRNKLNEKIEKLLLGFAAGVMLAASIWSLIIPSMEMAKGEGFMKVLPAAVGIILGMAFLLILDTVIPHLHVGQNEPEGVKSTLKKNTMMVFAVTLHNIPEGMTVGIILAGAIANGEAISMTAAFALAIGIALQNFPEGAVVSLPLVANGEKKGKAFLFGTLSGIVEPIAGLITILISSFITTILPYLLAFAAGAMIYVVVEELIPDSQSGKHSNIGTIGVALGFVVMMILDVVLG